MHINSVNDVFTSDGVQLILSTQHGEINLVEPFCTIDVDNDGDLDVFDLVFIMRYIQDFPTVVPPMLRTNSPYMPSDIQIV